MLRLNGYFTADLRCEATSLGVAQIRRRMVMIAWQHKLVSNLDPNAVPGGVLRDVLGGISDAPNHIARPLASNSPLALIASNIRPGQKLSNVRGGPRSVHTWSIPEVFGKTNAEERHILEALLKLRRQNRRRMFGDADPVSAAVLNRVFRRPMSKVLESLVCKGYVRRCGRFYDLVHTFNGKYRRLSWDLPSPTVDTRFGDPRYFLHPSENRGFSVREAARIQGFPDRFLFDGPERAAYRMIGNAVPPPVGSSLAKLVRQRILV
jgi:DNA (cytosine-5)-methyltransferase 1